MTPTRVRLTLEQKRLRRAHHAAHSELTRRELCEWSATAFCLSRPLAKSTLADTLKASVQKDDALSPSRKAAHGARFPQVEKELVAWIRHCEALRLAVVTGTTIMHKAEKIRRELLPTMDTCTATKLKAMKLGKGWLYLFQSRYGFKSRSVHGEAASVKTAAMEKGCEELQKATFGYAKRDIYNMDETAFYYCAIASKTVSSSSMPGRKQSKKRITVALTSNADGSSRPPLLFIGASRQPRCFLGKSSAELGIQYASSAKGWMTSRIFEEWIAQFNEDMKREGRHVLLLLDNVSSHRLDVALSNVEIRMLPPNTTSHLQPQDAGVIQAFKSKIHELQNKRVVDKLDELIERADGRKEGIESDVDSLYNTDVLEAMRWAEEAWKQVSTASIANCWRHTRILDEEMFELVEQMQSCYL